MNHQCSSNGIRNKLLITNIPASIPIVQMFDFMYFNDFIRLFHGSNITIIVIIQADNLCTMLIS